MKKYIILLMLCTLCVSCSRNYGEPVTKEFPISGTYTCLDISHAFEVTVSDQVTDVMVTVGEKAIDDVRVEVKDGTLFIGFNWWNFYEGEAKAVIPAGAVIDELCLSGASTFTGDLSGDEVECDLSGSSSYFGNISANDIDFDISGSSTYFGNVTTTTLEMDLSGSSRATISGSCDDEMEIGISGASNLNATGFDVQYVKGNMSGASTAYVNCCRSLRVVLSGASYLYYTTPNAGCNPVIDCQTTGSSAVAPMVH